MGYTGVKNPTDPNLLEKLPTGHTSGATTVAIDHENS